MVAAGLFTAVTPIVVIAAVALLSGAGRSTGLTCYSTIAFSDTPPDQIRDANTLQATAQQLSIGPRRAGRRGRAPGRAARWLICSPARSPPASAYTVAFLLLAVMALLATVAAFRLHPDAGSAVTRRPSAEPAPGHRRLRLGMSASLCYRAQAVSVLLTQGVADVCVHGLVRNHP